VDKKRIIHILNSNSYSGAENVVITIIESFRKLGYNEFEFIYVSLDGTIAEVLKKKNINFEFISKMTVSEIRRIIKKYNPSIIHAHDFTASIICSLATFKLPIISHLHNNSPWIKKLNVNSVVYALSTLKYKKILAVSESVLNEFIFGEFIKNKSYVIHNPIDIASVQQLAKTADEQIGFDVIFLGRLSTPKNPIRFVNIINQLKQKIPSLTVAMIGNGEMKQQVSEHIEKIGLGNTIALLGFKNNPYGILANSKLLCIPSSWEGFGLVAIEALALGKPVVASPVGGLVNIVNNSCGMLCESDEHFVNEICSLLNDKSYYNGKSECAFERAKNMNNISEYIDCLKRFYITCSDKTV